MTDEERNSVIEECAKEMETYTAAPWAKFAAAALRKLKIPTEG